MMFYHIVCWFVPIVLAIILLGVDGFSYADYGCWIEQSHGESMWVFFFFCYCCSYFNSNFGNCCLLKYCFPPFFLIKHWHFFPCFFSLLSSPMCFFSSFMVVCLFSSHHITSQTSYCFFAFFALLFRLLLLLSFTWRCTCSQCDPWRKWQLQVNCCCPLVSCFFGCLVV